MDLSYLANTCLFSLNSLIVTSLPGGSSDLLQKGYSRYPLRSLQHAVSTSAFWFITQNTQNRSQRTYQSPRSKEVKQLPFN